MVQASTSQTRNFTLLARTGSPSCVAHSRQTPQKYGLCVSQLLDNGYGVYELFNMLGFPTFVRQSRTVNVARRLLYWQAEYFSTATTNLAEHHKTMLRATVLAYGKQRTATTNLSRASQNNASKHGTCSTGKQRTAWSITKQCFQARYLLYWQAAYCNHSRASQNNALRG